MRIALLYPPPWKIPLPGQAPFASDGPPGDFRDGDLDADFYQTPYGLFSLGAQGIRAGHSVKVLNLSGFAWERVEEVVKELGAWTDVTCASGTSKTYASSPRKAPSTCGRP